MPLIAGDWRLLSFGFDSWQGSCSSRGIQASSWLPLLRVANLRLNAYFRTGWSTTLRRDARLWNCGKHV